VKKCGGFDSCPKRGWMLTELIRMGLYPSKKAFMETFFGPAYEEGKLKEVHQKMKHDIIGY